MTVLTLLFLYLSYRLKQVMCDFVLQTSWMALTKGKEGAEGYKALAAHALVHGVGSAIIFAIFAPSLWWVGLLDIIVHGIVDRTKSVLTERRGWTPANPQFWWAIGVDQEAHNLTHLVYILIICHHNGFI